MSKARGLCGAALLACAAAQAAPPGTPATEAQWIAAATRAVEYGRAHGMPISLEIKTGDGLPGHTPIGLASENGFCTLVVSARDNPTADRLTVMIAPDLLEVFLDGAAMHELGHCHRRLKGYPHNERLLPIVAWIKPVQDWFNRRIRTEEVYADMTEVAWLARHHPHRYRPVLEQIVKVRTRFWEPRHDTLPWLHNALAAGPVDGPGDVFAQAGELMTRHR